MNAREKFHAVMNFESVARNMKTEFGYWAGALRRWLKEGLPKLEEVSEAALDGDLVRGSSPLFTGSGELVDRNVMSFLGLDSYLAKFPFNLSPMLKGEVLEETEEYRIYKDSYGITKKVIKSSASTPLVIDYPIKTRKDFYRYKELYDSDYRKRFPKNWDDLKIALKSRDFPIRLGGNPYGFSFLPRQLMGDVGFMVGMYDDPALIKEFNEFFLQFVMGYWSLILEGVDIDCVMILEDIAYRQGSMISPAMFEEFIAPYCNRFVDFVKQHGVKYVFVDSDGLIEELILLWVRCGVDGLFPVEAVNDIALIREVYPNLRLMGGVDKRPLIHGSKDEIDLEIARIEAVMKKGGYVPHIDHAVPQDICWKSFRYYRERLNDIIDKAG